MRMLNYIRFKLMPMSKYPSYLQKLGAKIGDNCEIYKTVSFGSEPYLIEIGNHVRINANVVLSTHDGGCWVLRGLSNRYGKEFAEVDCFGKIIIEDNVHIAHGVIVLPGVRIGKNSIVGCGAVVTHDIPPDSVAAGVPARVIETIDEYANKMKTKCVFTKNLTPSEKKQYLIDKYL